MTYCVGLCLKDGLVFLSDTRTNAGVDQIGTFRKMSLFQKDKDRFFTLMSAGNLAITQAVKEILLQGQLLNGKNLWNVDSSHDAAVVIGDAIKQVYDRDHKALEKAGIDFNCNLIFGGQIKGERPRLFNIYSAGNFIEATPETCYFQIGESKYGKPILDRVISFDTPLNLATKCALISMDSTLNSNISVGLPLDLLVYEKNSLQASKLVTMDESNPYFQMIHQLWGEKLRSAFNSIAEPSWSGATPSRSIASPAKKMGAVPIHRATKKIPVKTTKASAKSTTKKPKVTAKTRSRV
ncbi:proteasome-type protease [Polynucleobacter asymbioticus]|jgi:putative proteasome-type protease|uniref:proteasome-type protease n=1 Tax=Polynucleobacter asymbioticus TaxID=576611 RepID=UPI001BFE5346|nr:proteasome-type protease [Polynucleobacter asymbioticus]QWD84716.1 proteasome-type protease [Polynucleobacter asymbioticus]